VHSLEQEILEYSKSGIAVTIHVAGKQPFATSIKKFYYQNDLKLVELNSETLYGQPITDTVLHIEEIIKIVPLFVRFSDPFYARLRALKRNVLRIKSES